MQAVVLAAGRGTRLRPVTLGRSKAMCPVVGRPLVERAIEPLVENGIRDFVFVISADDLEIVPHFEGLRGSEINPRFVAQDRRLGTAHALGTAAGLIEGPFVVWACDSLIDTDHVAELLDAAGEAEAVLSLLDVPPDLVSRSAAVELDGNIVRRIVEKPRLEAAPSHTVSLPHYVCSPEVLDLLPEVQLSSRAEFEFPDAIQKMIDRGSRVVGVKASARVQVTSPRDLLSLNRAFLRNRREQLTGGLSGLGRGVSLIRPVHIEDGADVSPGCEIGPEVYLEAGCRIGAGAVVRRSIILRDGRVAEGERIENAIVTPE
jgi:NDP-sugar pyrophosphorylase family protein